MEKEIYWELNDILKGSRVIDGDFIFKGWNKDDDSEDYVNLLYDVLEVLKEDIGNDYWSWYDKQVNRYIKYRKTTNKNESVYIPQQRFINEEHTVKQQLAVIKFFVYRKANSGY